MIDNPRPLAKISDEQRLAEHRCLECFRGIPEVSFAHDHGDPVSVCSECKAHKTIQKHLDRNEAADRTEVANLVKATISKSTSVPAVREIASKLTLKFGGVDGLVDRLYLNLTEVLDKHVGSSRAMDALKFIIRLIERGLEEQKIELEISALSDEQLDDIVGRFMRDRCGITIPKRGGNGSK